MFKTCLILSLALAGGSAFAADPFTEAMQRTYGPYRVALFKTNSNAQEDARKAVNQAQQGWNQLVSQFAENPPVPYDRDPGFGASLRDVGKVYLRATAEIEQNKLKEAHETLEQVREVMAELRHRNQVIVYSDHMNAYHAQMEALLNEGEKTLSGPNGMLEMAGQVGALAYLMAKLKTEAPADLQKNEEFNALYRAVEMSVASLKAAVLSQDSTKVREALGKIKAPYSRLFIKFG